MIGLLSKLADRSGTAFDKIPFVHADDQRASFPLDKIGNAQVLLLERLLRVDQQDHHLREPNCIEPVGDREFLELLLDPRPPPQPGSIVNPEVPVVPSQIDGDSIAGNAGFGAGEQPLLTQQAIDQGGFSGVRPAHHRDADERLSRRLLRDGALG